MSEVLEPYHLREGPVIIELGARKFGDLVDLKRAAELMPEPGATIVGLDHGPISRQTGISVTTRRWSDGRVDFRSSQWAFPAHGGIAPPSAASAPN